MPVRDVGNLRTRLAWEDGGTLSSLERFKQDLRGLRSEMKVVTSQGKEYMNSLKGLKEQQDILTRQLKTHQERLKELNKRYQEAVKAKGEDSKEAQALARQYNYAKAQMNETEVQLKRVTQAIEEQTKALEAQNNPWNRLSKNMSNAASRMQSVGERLSEFGQSYSMKVTAPVVGLGTAAIKTAMDFEQGMSRVRAIAGATEEEFQKMRETALKLGATTTKSASEVAAGFEQMAALGFEANEVIAAMPGVIAAAEASGSDLATTSEIIAAALNSFRMEASEATRVADILAMTANKSAANIMDMGYAFKYAAPVANTLGISIEELAAATGIMVNAGLAGEQAGTTLRMALLRLAKPTDEGAAALEKLGVKVKDANDNFLDLSQILPQFEKGLKGMSDAQKSATLATIFGTEAVSGMLALIDAGTGEFNDFTKALRNSSGASKEAAKIMMDNAAGAVEEFKGALESAAITVSENVLPALTDLIKDGTDLVNKFGELDKSTQKQILKWVGFAAALGPASLAIGTLTKGIGGVIKVGSSLAELLGKASTGTGLLSRISGLGMAGPVGLAVVGVGALGMGIAALSKAMSDNIEKTFEELEARQKQIQKTDEIIARYEELRTKNRLSNDEMLRFLDIQAEMEQTTLPEKIKELQDEQNELLKKSGLTNEEMQEFIGLNDKIIEQAPTTEKAISNQGRAFALNANELKKVNEEKLKSLKLDAEKAMQKVIERENELLRDQRRIIEEINSREAKIKETKQNIIDLNAQIQAKQAEINRLQSEKNNLDGHELVQHQAKIDHAQRELESLMSKKQREEEILNTLIGQLDLRYKNRDQIAEELKKLDEAKWRYEAIVLAQVGLNAERGKGLEKLNSEIARLEQQKEKLSELHRQGKLNTGEYQEQVRKIDAQIGRLKTAQSELRTINSLAGKTIYKDVKIRTSPSASKIDKEYSRPVNKPVWVHIPSGPRAISPYAEGTDYHKGGLALVGEEGPELARFRNKWALLDFGIYDLPRGTQVFTHGETKRILEALKRIPAYAEGVRPSGEANFIVNNLNRLSEPEQEPAIVIQNMYVRDETDIKKIARELHNLKVTARRAAGYVR